MQPIPLHFLYEVWTLWWLRATSSVSPAYCTLFPQVLALLSPYLSVCNIFYTFLQHYSNLSDTDRDNLQTLLYTVINKYKYDKDYNFSNQV